MNEPSGNNGRPLVSFAELVFMSNPIYILASQHCYIKVMVLDLAAARKVPDMIKQHHFFNRSMSLGGKTGNESTSGIVSACSRSGGVRITRNCSGPSLCNCRTISRQLPHNFKAEHMQQLVRRMVQCVVTIPNCA
jgi:hypothetical protein